MPLEDDTRQKLLECPSVSARWADPWPAEHWVGGKCLGYYSRLLKSSVGLHSGSHVHYAGVVCPLKLKQRPSARVRWAIHMHRPLACHVSERQIVQALLSTTGGLGRLWICFVQHTALCSPICSITYSLLLSLCTAGNCGCLSATSLVDAPHSDLHGSP